MMKKYIFKSWNDNWEYVYDIQGESFRKLIETCTSKTTIMNSQKNKSHSQYRRGGGANFFEMVVLLK